MPLLSARINRYDHARYNLLTGESSAPLSSGSASLALGYSLWTVTLASSPVAERAEALDCVVTFTCISGAIEQASVSVVLEFPEWSEEHYVLMPSAVYKGNRFPSRRLRYSPKLYEVQDIGPDKPIIVSDIPRLSDNGGVSRIQERSASMATPSIGFHDATLREVFWLLCPHGNPLGDYGMSIEESRSRDRAWISLTSPVVRESHSYRMCDARHPSADKPANFRQGDSVEIRFRTYRYTDCGLQGLFDRFSSIRKDLTPRPAAPRRLLPASVCLEAQEAKFNAVNFVPEHGYYSVGLRENFLQDWQIGWTGGMIMTQPLLFAGSKTTRDQVLRNFDWLFPWGICPAGFFWDSGRKGTEWIGGDIRKPHTGNWHLIRKSGDGVFYILQQFDLMEKLGIAVKPSWDEGTRRVCNAFVRLWAKWGQFGQFVDSLTGDVVVGGSSSGAIIPAALALAWRRYGDRAYLDTALAAAAKYHRDFTSKGLSCGGPGDALQNIDSESWYSLLESYVALYEATGDKLWLERAADQSRQFSTWVVTYDYPFPETSLFGREGIRSLGAVYANTQNKHAAPGLCTFSGLGLLKLFRATGDRFHLELLQDIARNMSQYLPHPLKPLGTRKTAHMCERVNLTDWEGPEMVGELVTPTNWVEISLMLTAVELPGLYVQPDTGLVMPFDAIEAKIVGRRDGVLEVEVHNPTPAPATVRLLVETSTAAKTPLAGNYLLSTPSFLLALGETKRLPLANAPL